MAATVAAQMITQLQTACVQLEHNLNVLDELLQLPTPSKTNDAWVSLGKNQRVLMKLRPSTVGRFLEKWDLPVHRSNANELAKEVRSILDRINADIHIRTSVYNGTHDSVLKLAQDLLEKYIKCSGG